MHRINRGHTLKALLPVLLAILSVPAFAQDAPKPGTAKAIVEEVTKKAAPKELVPMPELTWAANKIKNVPVGPTKLSFGLAHRTRVEVWDNRIMPGNGNYTNGLTYFRTRLWMDADLHKYVRVFAMGQDARKDGDTRARARAWEDKPDLLEGYVDFRNLFDLNLTVRIGRQALVYGKQRLVGSFEWSNPGRRFDAVRVFWKSKDKNWTADAFASKVVVVEAEQYNQSHPTEEFYGLYATNHMLKNHHFEAYTFARLNESGKVRDETGGLGDLRIVTHGFRAYGGKFFKGLDYEVEASFQWGDQGKGNHLAAAAHAEVGYTFLDTMWKPRVAFEYNFGSGDDDPTDGDNGTFNNLFPTNHLHYGYSDYVNWSNTHNLALGAKAHPLTGVTIWAKAHLFWVADDKDAWRNAGGGVLGRDVSGGSGTYVGAEFDVGVTAKINRHLKAQVGYSIFDGGEFARDTRPGNAEMSQFFWASLAFKF